VTNEQDLQSWDLTNVYPGLDSEQFSDAKAQLSQAVDDLKSFVDKHSINPDVPRDDRDIKELADVIAEFIRKVAAAQELRDTIRAYLNSFISTDTFNEKAKKELSRIEPLFIRLDQLETVRFQAWLGQLGEKVSEVIENNISLKGHAFYLQNMVEQSVYMMSQAEEELASELFLSGATAWNKLQSNITSQLSWPVEYENGEIKTLPMTAIINLRAHESETMRRRGYEAEMEAWKTVEVPLAAAMNGVKGSQVTIFRRRGRADAIHKSLDQARIDRETLEAMLESIRSYLPVFHKYFLAKAKRLGKESLAWWDLAAPIGRSKRKFTYPEAQQFVIENFGKFSEELAEYANHAFTNQWVDVGPRKGKRAGAFCMRVPAVKESRILLNFEENLDWVFTLAHELGHGFHNHCLFEAGRDVLQIRTPMTMAETASIMCETIVTNAAIKMAADEDEELLILETSLIGDSQVLVDIYSRYLFETEVFKHREVAELSADEFNEIMEWAQGEAYGDSLDEKYRHKYMWTWKPHYYFPGLAFYNYPYAFGLLFGTGLFAIYQERGPDFIPEYKSLLASTGMGTSAELAARFGIDLHSPDFWRGSLRVIGERIERYMVL